MPPLREAFPSCSHPSWGCSCHCQQALRWATPCAGYFHGFPWARSLLGVFLFGTGVCVQPSPTGVPAS